MNEIEWEACLLEPRPSPEYEARFRRETGRPGKLMRYWEGCDWLSDAVVRLSVQLGTYVVVEPDLVDQAGLVVSQDNSCRFCYGAQRVLLQALGMSKARIAKLDQQILIGEISPRDAAALGYARKMSRAQPLASKLETDALREAEFDSLQIAELSGHIALHMFFNRVSTFVALPPGDLERLSEAWWMTVLRPFLKRYFLRLRMNPSPVAPDPDHAAGPFGAIIGALDGLPMAGDLRIVLDNTMASRALSPRAAPLAFAVVSRALGCRASEAEARRLLAELGTDAEEIDAVLTHLSSEGLSEVEQTTVTFAREAVWYAPADIQRRCRALHSRLSREQFLELMGIVSLANSICRLAVITGDCT